MARKQWRPGVEVLAARVTPAAAVLDVTTGIMTITGTDLGDQITISRNEAGTIQIADQSGSVTPQNGTPTVTNTNAISILAGPGDDTITLDQSVKLFGPGISSEPASINEIEISIDGELGTDTLLVLGRSGADDTFDLGTAGFNLNGDDDVDLALASIEVVTVDGQGGDDRLNAAGSSVAGSPFAAALQLLGGAGNDFLIGGLAKDTLDGGDGDDQLSGRDGHDLLDGGAGSDRVQEAGNIHFTLTDVDLTTSPLAGDTVPPALGHDLLASIERASLTGGAGNNTLDAGAFSGAAALDGQAGDDSLVGGTGADSLTGGPGDDALVGGTGADTVVDAANGNLRLTNTRLTGFGPDTLSGIEQGNLTGGPGDNLLDASEFTGPVTLAGAGGDDVLIGGTNDDSLRGGGGKDHLVGGQGQDRLQGGHDNDLLDGGNGLDIVVEEGDANFHLSNTRLHGLGNDVLVSLERAHLSGGLGNNTLRAEHFTLGPVTLDGGAGNDRLTGTHHADSLLGGDGKDTLTGGHGNDSLRGGAGNDFLFGLLGDDLLDGGAGNDHANGGKDTDTTLEAEKVKNSEH